MDTLINEAFFQSRHTRCSQIGATVTRQYLTPTAMKSYEKVHIIKVNENQ